MDSQPKPEIRLAFIAAANKGDLDAAYTLAKWADDARAWFECLTWLEPAIKKKFPPALHFLSTKYLAGRGVPQDFFEAKRLAQESAELGHYPSTLQLANFHSTEKYHNFNPDGEWIWLSRAGELEPEHWGYSPLQSARFKIANRLIQNSYLAWSERQPLGLSDALLAGSKISTEDECIKSAEKLLLKLSDEEIFDSTDPDTNWGEYWRGNGTDGGYTATGLLARLYMDGQLPFKDNDLGLGYLKKGAEIKDPECRYRLAVMLFSGDTVSMNRREAACLWHEVGNSEAQGDPYQILSAYAYAKTCLEGTGIRRDEAEAKEWLGFAADNADPLAQFELGLCFFKGIGCSIDNQEAYF